MKLKIKEIPVVKNRKDEQVDTNVEYLNDKKNRDSQMKNVMLRKLRNNDTKTKVASSTLTKITVLFKVDHP